MRRRLHDLKTFGRVVWSLGVRARYRRLFWRTLTATAWRNPSALRDVVSLMALFLQFDAFRDFLVAQIDERIERAEESERSPVAAKRSASPASGSIR